MNTIVHQSHGVDSYKPNPGVPAAKGQDGKGGSVTISLH